MQLRFYKGEFGDYWDKLICFWTRGPYSHVELHFGDDECFSSSSRDNGVRFKTIPLTDRWAVVDIGHEDIKSDVRAWCQSEVGKQYDWAGAIGCGLWLNLSSKNKRFCSEVTMMALDRFKIRHCPDVLSPNRMYEMVIRSSPRTSDHLPT